VKSNSSRIGRLLYDPAVAIHMTMTYYQFFTVQEIGSTKSIIGMIFYAIGLTLFWWANITAKKLEFAFSSNVGNIVTTGPFAIIRHPFYTSYIFVWLSSTILFNSSTLWTTLFFLVAFYVSAAVSEERVILRSQRSREYREYSQHVGMFLPRKKIWKN